MALSCMYCGKERKKNGKPYKTQQNLLDHEKQCPKRGTGIIELAGTKRVLLGSGALVKVTEEPKRIKQDFSDLPQALQITREEYYMAL